MTSTSRTARPPIALRARDVADLTVASGYPCISVLMPTQPGPRMTPSDVQQLHALVVQVDRELSEYGVTNRARLLRKLAAQVSLVAAQPTDQGLVIYVSRAVTRSFGLPQPVQPRVVVENLRHPAADLSPALDATACRARAPSDLRPPLRGRRRGTAARRTARPFQGQESGPAASCRGAGRG